MDPVTILSLANGLISLIEALAPDIAKLFTSGQISTADQAALTARLDALRGSAAFTGPEWAQSGQPVPTTTAVTPDA